MINQLGKKIYQNAQDKGFYEKEKNIGEMLCLIHSEVSEALEADRKDKYAGHTGMFKKDNENYLQESKDWFEMNIKNTFEDELADVMIRVMDLAAFKGIDLEWHILKKMQYNAQREKYHGKKY